jgi:hypothetical protein
MVFGYIKARQRKSVYYQLQGKIEVLEICRCLARKEGSSRDTFTLKERNYAFLLLFFFMVRYAAWNSPIILYPQGKKHWARYPWLTPVTPTTWKAEIRRINVRG